MLASFFRTGRPVFPPEHPGSEGDRDHFRDGSWFRRRIPIEPGHFVLPGPDDPAVYNRAPPPRQVKGEVLDPRRYLGRVYEIHGKTLALTMWEVPNSRELFASVDRAARGVSTVGSFRLGTVVELWTWSEMRDGIHIERLHIVARPGSLSKKTREK